MSNQPCLICPETLNAQETLPDTIASQIEDLRQERLRAFIEQSQTTEPVYHASSLERRVDSLLDTLNVLHRLEQLAGHVAHGGQITVDADRLLIAEYPDTFQDYLDRFTGQQPVFVTSLLLTSAPRPLD